jgi:hypothetical protein
VSLSLYCLKAQAQWLSHHHHAWAATKGAVIYSTVSALGEIAWIPKVHIDQADAVFLFKSATVDADR